ncbi:DUF3306 domain-containing protein [Vibrio tapetis subsp. quintayensis]|uniref:DUF3306 domain-containing protein n=1 Tax=Vibrio tapetis TaxID=52443 RepID=UPI0025B556DA|nr:DUF3306 domain-containing protein [Vibrio tapetis]MDN3679154.1 DUF3306 domain-containing protein [Vibrio tapetis subsp. quintayensis]
MANNFFKRWSDNKLTKQDDARDADITPEPKFGIETSSSKGSFVEVETEKTQVDALDNGAVAGESSADSIEQGSEAADPQNVESLSVANILADGIKGSVKKQALRNLFLSGEFSEVDRLNDYDHDYQSVKSLSADAASQLRNWLNDQMDDETELSDSELADEQMTTEQERQTQDGKGAKPNEVNEELVSDAYQTSDLVTDSYQSNNENYSGLTGAGDK